MKGNHLAELTEPLRPIIFRDDMVRTVIAETKTETRRVKGLELLNADPDDWHIRGKNKGGVADMFNVKDRKGVQLVCPYGKPGDLLWVREAWIPVFRPSDGQDQGIKGIRFRADGCLWRRDDAASLWTMDRATRWRAAIHLRRKFARLFLHVKDVWLQRVKMISVGSIRKEGLDGTAPDLLSGWRSLWHSIHKGKPTDYDRDPWVWAIVFKVVADRARGKYDPGWERLEGVE